MTAVGRQSGKRNDSNMVPLAEWGHSEDKEAVVL